jgi:hypothetical protein
MDLCKIRISCISRQELRRAMDTNDYSRNGCISRTVYQGPDIVDDTQEHLDDTYVESLENTRPATEDLVSEDPDFEDDGFYHDENLLE